MNISKKIIVSLSILFASLSSLSATEVIGVLRDATNKPLAGYTLRNTSTLDEVISSKTGSFLLDIEEGDLIEILHNNRVIESTTVKSVNGVVLIQIKHNPYKFTVVSPSSQTIDRERTSAGIDVVTSEELEAWSGYSSANTIIGKLASLSTIMNTGLMNADYATLYVRGKSAFSSNTALVLVDGFESSLSTLSNLEIESITVLKDAVALAPYGMRGANGVVLVTTKKGTPGKPQFKINVEYGVLSPDLSNSQYVDATAYSTMVNEARANDGLTPMYTEEQITLQGSNEYLYPNIDWQDLMLKKMSQQTSASIEMTGGSNNIRYYTMLDMTTYDGALNYTTENNGYDLQNDMFRLNFRSNISLDVTKDLTMNVRLGGMLDTSTALQYGMNNYFNLLAQTPANRFAIFNEDGSVNGSSAYQINPFAQLTRRGFFDYHTRSFDANIDLNYSLDAFVKGLSVSAAISFASEALVQEAYWGGNYAVYEPYLDADGNVESYGKFGADAQVGFGAETATQDRTEVMRAALNYNRTFGEHSIIASMMAERSENTFQDWAEPFKYVNYNLVANYGYANKYFADISMSYAGTQAFEYGSHMGLFPAVGLSWIASNEEFLLGHDAVNFLKLRASAGIVGNAGDNRFLYLANYASDGTYSFGETTLTTTTGLSESALTDTEFTWQRGFSYNAGVDMRLFNNSLALSFDVFSETRVDILDDFSNIITSTVVYPNYYSCYGQVRNQGFDFTAGFRDSYNNLVNYKISANGGLAKNQILQQYQIANYPTTAHTKTVDDIYGYIAEGFYSSQDEIDNSPVSMLGTMQPGDIKYKDVNGDNCINEYDMVNLGTSFPTFNYGVNLNVEVLNFYIDLWMDGSLGGSKNLVSNVIYSPLNGNTNNISQYAADNYWTAERAGSATLPRLSYDYNYSNSQNSSLFTVSSNFMRLRTAEFGYNLPESFLNRMKLSRANLYVRGHNLFVIDAMPGLDAEFTTNFPMSKSVHLGLNVGF